MRKLSPFENQEYISFSGEDLIILDKIQSWPENSTYYSEYVLIMICTEGKIQVDYDGKSITVQKDEIFLGVPGSVLSDYMLSPNFDCKIFAVKPSAATTSRVDLQSNIFNSSLYIKTHPVAEMSEVDRESVFGYYNLICNRIQRQGYRYHNGEVRSLLNAFLMYVIGMVDRDMEDSGEERTVRGEQIAEKFVMMVNDDCGHHRLVSYYADKLNITSKYLSTIVRSAFGRTPLDVIRMVTMKEIERRLLYSEDSIKEISHALNFPNTSFFGKYFKQYAGMTPNSYRKKYSK